MIFTSNSSSQSSTKTTINFFLLSVNVNTRSLLRLVYSKFYSYRSKRTVQQSRKVFQTIEKSTIARQWYIYEHFTLIFSPFRSSNRSRLAKSSFLFLHFTDFSRLIPILLSFGRVYFFF